MFLHLGRALYLTKIYDEADRKKMQVPEKLKDRMLYTMFNGITLGVIEYAIDICQATVWLQQ